MYEPSTCGSFGKIVSSKVGDCLIVQIVSATRMQMQFALPDRWPTI